MKRLEDGKGQELKDLGMEGGGGRGRRRRGRGSGRRKLSLGKCCYYRRGLRMGGVGGRKRGAGWWVVEGSERRGGTRAEREWSSGCGLAAAFGWEESRQKSGLGASGALRGG